MLSNSKIENMEIHVATGVIGLREVTHRQKLR